MIFVKAAKSFVRSHIGLWPAMEWRNKLVMGWRTPGLTRFENAEVARLRSHLGTTPSARIACIIPTYKRPEGVVAAINSILAQECQDFVIIVVDDGAGLPALPSDPRLFSVSLSRNTGVLGLVRNVGVRLSNSEFIAFLDDDNTWTKDHLSKAIPAIVNGTPLIYTAICRRRPDGSVLDVLSKPFDRKKFSDESGWVDANAIVLSRSAFLPFSRLPRTTKTLPKEDWEFVWRVSKNSSVTHVPEVTVNYLVNPESYFTAWSGSAVSALPESRS